MFAGVGILARRLCSISTVLGQDQVKPEVNVGSRESGIVLYVRDVPLSEWHFRVVRVIPVAIQTFSPDTNEFPVSYTSHNLCIGILVKRRRRL